MVGGKTAAAIGSDEPELAEPHDRDGVVWAIAQSVPPRLCKLAAEVAASVGNSAQGPKGRRHVAPM